MKARLHGETSVFVPLAATTVPVVTAAPAGGPDVSAKQDLNCHRDRLLRWGRAKGLRRQIVQPPETSITAPLMYDASSEASHA